MKIRTNSKMIKLLEKRKYDFIKETISLPIQLHDLINAGFREEQSCIVFHDLNSTKKELLDSEEKKTEYECFLNDIHIDDYLTDISDEFNYLKIGLEFSKKIYEKLKKTFQKDFRITLSYSETTYDREEIDTYGGCVVQFYTIRKACDYKFRIDNLDDFEIDAVLVIE